MKLIKLKQEGENYLLINDVDFDETLQIDMTGNPFCWEQFGFPISDVIVVRDRVKEIYDTIGWSNIKSIEAKQCIARCMPEKLLPNELAEVLSPSEISEALVNYRLKSKIARQDRWETLRVSVSLLVQPADAVDFYESVASFEGKYYNLGYPHLICWLTNGSYGPLGIDFTLNGFAQKSYFSEDIKQLAIDILTLGKHFITII